MKHRSQFSRGAGAAALLIAALAGVSPVQADIYVIESSVAAIKVGSNLADADKLSIPSGGAIRAVLPSGKTQTIRGPYDGQVADLAKGHAQNEGVLAWLRNMMQTGGARESTAGATRSAAPGAARPSVKFSWTGVPTFVDGDFCVQKGAKLQLVRAPSRSSARIAIVDVAGAQRGEAEWAPGSEAVAWPGGLVPKPDAAYLLMVQDRPRRQVTLRVLDKLPGEDDLLTELQARGCKQQFEAWVREKMATAK